MIVIDAERLTIVSLIAVCQMKDINAQDMSLIMPKQEGHCVHHIIQRYLMVILFFLKDM